MNPPASLTAAVIEWLRRDLRIAYRRRGALLQPPLFFILVAALFALASPASQSLADFAPAVLWIAVLLVTLLALPALFDDDYADGTLQQILLTPHPPTLFILAKLAVHWLATAVPLILVSPLLAEILHLPRGALLVAVCGLLCGTPALSCIGGVGAALTVAAGGRGGALLALLVLPLYAPTLIFGTVAIRTAVAGGDPLPHLLLLAAGSLFAAAVAPLAIVAALRAGG